MIEVCALCGRADRDLKSDHLRHVWVMARGSGLDSGFYQPHLSIDELWVLRNKGGRLQTICNNRGKCKAQQQVNRGA